MVSTWKCFFFFFLKKESHSVQQVGKCSYHVGKFPQSSGKIEGEIFIRTQLMLCRQTESFSEVGRKKEIIFDGKQ